MIGTRALSNSAAHDPHVSQTDRQTGLSVKVVLVYSAVKNGRKQENSNIMFPVNLTSVCLTDMELKNDPKDNQAFFFLLI